MCSVAYFSGFCSYKRRGIGLEELASLAKHTSFAAIPFFGILLVSTRLLRVFTDQPRASPIYSFAAALSLDTFRLQRAYLYSKALACCCGALRGLSSAVSPVNRGTPMLMCRRGSSAQHLPRAPGAAAYRIEYGLLVIEASLLSLFNC